MASVAIRTGPTLKVGRQISRFSGVIAATPVVASYTHAGSSGVPLTPGTRLGPYEITAQIGGAAWARCIAHRHETESRGRDQGPAGGLCTGPRAPRTFRARSQVLASLNHPTSRIIHGLEVRRHRALVMELVEGPTLADRIHGPIPLEEALPIAKQIAEAWKPPTSGHRPSRSQAGQRESSR